MMHHSRALLLLLQMRLRKMMIEMVLGTDMKQHWTIMSRFQTKLQVKIHTSITTAAANTDDAGFNSNSEADRFLVLQVPALCNPNKIKSC